MGSSPLARGLQSITAQLASNNGIIPARAGFTRPGCRSMRARGDHPRSRGVYPRSCPASHWAVWIIPARAGFTFSFRATIHWARDHPRSRGVYNAQQQAIKNGRGSSPLARGLLLECPFSLEISRIIPARAGVTTRANSNP